MLHSLKDDLFVQRLHIALSTCDASSEPVTSSVFIEALLSIDLPIISRFEIAEEYILVDPLIFAVCFIVASVSVVFPVILMSVQENCFARTVPTTLSMSQQVCVIVVLPAFDIVLVT